MKNFMKFLRHEKTSKVLQYIAPLSIILIVIAFMMTTVVLKGRVVSDSMNTSLKDGDGVIGFRLAYLYKVPLRGDIVAVEGEEERWIIKRVIGLPGDVIEFVNGAVYINNEYLEEPYVQGVTVSPNSENIYYVPDGCVMLLGDNRERSVDGREWDRPYVTVSSIRAKIIFKYTTVRNILKGVTPGFQRIK